MESDKVGQTREGQVGHLRAISNMERVWLLAKCAFLAMMAGVSIGSTHASTPSSNANAATYAAWLDPILLASAAYLVSPPSVTDPADTLSDQFIPAPGGPMRLALTSRAYWLKLQITNPTAKSVSRCLDVRSSAHASIMVFVDAAPSGHRWREMSALAKTSEDGPAEMAGVCGGAPNVLYGPLEIGAAQTLTILIRIRSLQPLVLSPQLLSPALAKAEVQRRNELSLVAIVTAGVGTMLMLLWSLFGGRDRHWSLALNTVASFFWVSMMDNALAYSTGILLLQKVSPYGALAGGVLFAGSYLLSYQKLFSGERGQVQLQRLSQLAMLALALGLLLSMTWGVRELVQGLWLLIAIAPFLTLAHSWRFWMHHQVGSTPMFSAHVGLLLMYAWQMLDAWAVNLLPPLAPEMHVTWLVGLLLHHAAWLRAMDINEPGAHLSGSRSSVAMLEAEVGRRTEDLRIARESAERMAALQRDFLATMSHELRTPLASVVGLCRMLGDDAALPERARKDMGTVERLAVHLLRMVDDGLAYVRQRGKEEPVMRKPVNMRFLLRDMDSVSRWLSQRQGNEFTMLKVRSVPPVLHFDEQRLRQVLINLVSNAGRYCHNGQVTLGVSFAADNEPALSWTIADSGRGMSAEELEKVFEPFVKSRDSQGLGLGLALVKKLTSDMGGTIRVQSQIGLGTQFYVTIPVSIEGESLEEMRLDSNTTNQHQDAMVSRPMTLLPERELDMLQLDELREHLRLGQLSEIEEWIQSVELTAGLSHEAERFIRKVRQAAADVDLTAIGVLIDQIDTPLN